MRNKINKHISAATLVLACMAAMLLSCKKFVENGTPPNAISQNEAFIDSATATSVILGLYSLNNTSTSTLNINRYGPMSANDAYFLTNATYDMFKNNTLSGGNNDASSLWLNMYSTIGRANYAIEGVQSSSTLSTSVKNQLTGEAKFWRAYYYFYLVNFFGDVPLVTNTNALFTSTLPRTSASQVYQQIVTDLTEAKNLLTNTYPSIERARINKRVAAAMLARVYFYLQNWTAARGRGYRSNKRWSLFA